MRESSTVKVRSLISGLLVSLTAILPTVAADLNEPAKHGPVQAADYYVALGDSLSVGVQIVNGSRANTDQGYADDLYARARKSNPRLQLVKFGCGGETTGTMIAGDPDHITDGCPHPYGSQLNDALAFLNAHPGHIQFITIDIGINDIIEGVDFSLMTSNLTTILVELRQAVGPNVPIVGSNYADPLLVDAYESGGLPGLQAEVQNADAIDGFLDDIYTAQGMPFADVLTAFFTDDTHLVRGTPRDVDSICRWTYWCSFGDLHPNSAGYRVIADAFARALGFRCDKVSSSWGHHHERDDKGDDDK